MTGKRIGTSKFGANRGQKAQGNSEHAIIVRCTLVDGITRHVLFNVWNEEQDLKRKTDAVLRSTTDFDKYENQQQLKFRKIVKNFNLFVGKK
ncbi:hypothetical protein TNCV_3809251 [Trichonephila clavipes]|nr:hypothetical protein TNCV_3809251 [Trichonephila clavipes]